MRPISSDEELPVLSLSPDDIGIIKSAPVERWLHGQELWRKRFETNMKEVEKQQNKYIKRTATLLAKGRAMGLLDDQGSLKYSEKQQRLVTVFDLGSETPPPSAVAGRRDNVSVTCLLYMAEALQPDSFVLFQAALYRAYKAAPPEVKHVTRPLVRPRYDVPRRFPHQSPSEQQLVPVNPLHGLAIWSDLMG